MEANHNVLPLTEASSQLAVRRDGRLGSLLTEEGKLNAADVQRVLELQRVDGLQFGAVALRLGLINAEDLRRAVAKQHGLPELLPSARSISSELVVAHAPFHPRAEELRALRTQLLIRWSNAQIRRRMLVIASPCHGEGRSYVAANLAVVFSQLGQRTLLIDSDLRTPRQHEIFNVPNRVGLSAVLSGRADCSAVVPVTESGTLSLLPAGACPPNPQELLLRSTFVDLLDELAGKFDIVLFDTPPAKAYADAQGVAFRAGSALLIARKDHTRMADTKNVIHEMSGAGTHIVGSVFNAF